MTTRPALALLLCLAACAPRPANPVAPASPTPPAPAQPMNAAPNLVLTSLDQRATLIPGTTLTLRYDNLVIESIEPSPDGNYPAGSGITLNLHREGGAPPLRRNVSLLSSGYTSRNAAWFDDVRVTLLDVKDPQQKSARVELLVERVTAEPAGDAREVRVTRGQSLELAPDTRVEFLGNSTKEISAGERPPLLVAVRYLVSGEEPVSSEFNVGPDDTPQIWTWRDQRFTVLKYAYNEWMQVKVQRLRLAPTS